MLIRAAERRLATLQVADRQPAIPQVVAAAARTVVAAVAAAARTTSIETV
jgi:hypothetical protein